MDIGDALRAAKAGSRIARSGWNGCGMHVELRRPEEPSHLPYLVLRTVDGTWVPWVVSQTDALAEDWEVV